MSATLQAQGVWTQKADFGGPGRVAAVSFSIGTKGYLGTGRTGLYPSYTLYKDFWEWDQSTNAWTQKADFGGSAMGFAVAFTVGDKAFVAGGGEAYGWFNTYQKDLWEFDPATNLWTQKADYIGGNGYPYGAFATYGFSIGKKVYMGKGYDNSGYDTLFEWDGDTTSLSYNTWAIKTISPGSFIECISFSIGTRGYAGLSRNWSGHEQELWEWDQTTSVWTQKADFPGAKLVLSSIFTIGSKAYICTGSDGNNNYRKDLWEWDKNTNIWSQKNSFNGAPREKTIAFSIGSKGYVGLKYGWLGYYTDFWEFDPNGNGISEAELSNSITTYPSPTSGKFSIQSLRFKVQEIKIFDSNGKLVEDETLNLEQGTLNCDLSSESNGIYFLKIKIKEGIVTKKVILNK